MSFSSTSRFGAANPTCGTCGGRLRGAKKCACEEPDWKPIGKRRNAENEGLPDDMTGGGMARQMSAMQDWHYRWAVEALRVAKPGCHLLAFGGTRTFHRLACAIEDAGWEIRDSIEYLHDGSSAESLLFQSLTDDQRQAYLNLHHGQSLLSWVFGTGFPKSLDVGKSLDAAAGAEREAKAWDDAPTGAIHEGGAGKNARCPRCGKLRFDHDACVCPRDNGPQTDAARQWSGWGTALKPAFEIIVVARKPLDGTVAANVLKWGVGAINVDGCRVSTDDSFGGGAVMSSSGQTLGKFGPYQPGPEKPGSSLGRWPANLILTIPEDEFMLKPDVTEEQKREVYQWLQENG